MIYRSKKGSVDIVKYLLSLGANVKAKVIKDCTALLWTKTVETAKTHVEQGADVEAIRDSGSVPFICKKKTLSLLTNITFKN